MKHEIIRVIPQPEVKKLKPYDVLQILKDEGIVYQGIIMDVDKYLKRCHLLGVKPPL